MKKWVKKVVKKQVKKAEKNGVIGAKATKNVFTKRRKRKRKNGGAKVKKIDCRKVGSKITRKLQVLWKAIISKNYRDAVKDHCHITGRYRGAAHNERNKKYRNNPQNRPNTSCIPQPEGLRRAPKRTMSCITETCSFI